MRIIAGSLKGRQLKTGSGPGYRPATGKVREALFSMLEAPGLVWETTRVLDLFAGSGSLGFETLSRGGSQALFVENSASACALIRQNIASLSLADGKAQVIKNNVLSFLKKSDHGEFDLIFVDPPYGKNILEPVMQSLITGSHVKHNGLICAEIENDPNINVHFSDHLLLLKDKSYGQTRILIWKKQ
ncbi:16S rRNA (guanine(966)-N(2))-methyltransferase RsmD [Desulfonatronovibrio magnus]|uniref:16S rRNA (guanine(966)-N(2))-methyltransferase RsmD n=1 Tax=Desulfonatronovibrio magnus TaxID=698827 RepID=UPI0005EBE072|nr:16S rRNA (guanine(966)-N(2))-methyltransferase RsmD [Desulfonatronovibrio magnus]RQD59743.1 MAG: 16S rRNA (guanine(966)-N(2))-methyltransferase RsmD [Desulfonatronovibrio sp. MSAO_Bac4]